MTSKADVIFVLILLAVPALYATLTSDSVLAEDWNRHGPWIERYMHGDFTPFLEYPPAFHFLMIPFVAALGDNIRLMQIPLGFLAGASAVLLSRKYLGNSAAFLVGILLLSSIDFGIMSMGLWPQTIDYILMPLAIFLLLEKKYMPLTAILTFLMYAHMTGTFIFAFFLLYSLIYDKKFLKYLAVIILISIPIAITCYVPSILNILEVILCGSSDFMSSGQFYTNDWYQYYVSPWWRFFAFSGVPIWLLLAVSIKRTRLRKLTRFEKVMLLWILAMSPLLAFSLMRGIAYMVVPMAIFSASVITRYENERKKV